MKRIALRLCPWGSFTLIGEIEYSYSVVCCREILKKDGYKNNCRDQQFSKCDFQGIWSQPIFIIES